ncbi:MAG: hypothetical protein CVU69_01585 [Deltaproteobacteria bacterium HGW-Deltaproteobacteria-4]|nr:MAG: hypothetical protein CVU69_01585 [Deltaproteobacteria bacterium HGW-Deltaproteobacteria-4]
MQELCSDIRVAVIFGPEGRIRPVWFELKSRRHDVRTITNRWRERRGAVMQWHFHVTDDGALFELIFNPGAATWQLLRIEAL